MEQTGRHGLRQRIFAWMYSRDNSEDTDSLFDAYRRKLIGGLAGDVLEIGAGTGANFAYFPAGVRWLGIEPNLYMHPMLKAEARQSEVTIVDIRPTISEHLDLPDASMDAVVSTHVLCSVNNQRAVLQEVRRVLRPGGQFVFLEHVAAPRGTLSRAAQTVVKPAWHFFGDGCHPDRETWAVIEKAGFSQVEIEHFRAPYPIVSPHIAGYAVK
jgi:ubiquinone/menaquinone biosynthesis C-methylase UbiE